MPIHVKAAGVWKEVKDVFIKSGGVWTPVEYVRTKIAGVWTVVHQAETVIIVSTNQTGLILSSLFTTAEWTSTKKKRVIIQAGVVIGGVSWGALAIQSGGNAAGASWGGELRLDNYGEIRGIGGAPNGGVGGTALYQDTVNFAKKCILRNYGAIRAGGGGGGRGGNGGTGGQGYYENRLGPYYDGNNYYWNSSSGYVHWAGVRIANGVSGSSYSSGGYTYYRGTSGQSGASFLWSISRGNIVYTSGGGGGAGGNGGRGMGSDGANTGGAGGAAGAYGGTNAGRGGTGGTGGAGGGWGAAGGGGNTGATGASGNYTGGSPGAGGAAGGAAGIAYRAALWQIEVAGTIQGRVV